MQIRKDVNYYKNLHTVVSNALLHLLSHIAGGSRYVPVGTRNEILVKYFKVKLKDRRFANIKKDLRLMISTGRSKAANLEMKLYELNEQARRTKLAGAEKLYSLLVYLFDSGGFESRLFEEGVDAEPGIIYMIEEHLDHCFDCEGIQVAAVSMLLQSEKALELVDVINQHGDFIAEVHEWEPIAHQAHIHIHPVP
ncbi:DUF2913 family protein [Vibrio scophthalmi]|uniref:DUF2913 family protein n=1 Tax=Vibrio scophthalmi TaxID=45658 RepID=A0A1C7FKD4_9VIBR|nr:DUF2913 family protein [Vibrio scophthalmi]ANU39469.1 hypothetical protein VSVS05_04434 [Vibrio scophthalmi]